MGRENEEQDGPVQLQCPTLHNWGGVFLPDHHVNGSLGVLQCTICTFMRRSAGRGRGLPKM